LSLTDPINKSEPSVQPPFGQRLLAHPSYRYYALVILTLGYAVNVMDRAVLGVLNEAIKEAFSASDKQLGLLGGMAFALFYATFGIPIAAWADRSNRRDVLAFAVSAWSAMTAICGMALNFTMLLAARAGTAVGEAGGTPPSHALISDYFPLRKRATALSLYALGVPLGAMAGSYLGGWGNQLYGWRWTFILVGLPGILFALLIRFTLIEPTRGMADNLAPARMKAAAPPILEVFKYLWHERPAFRHVSLAAALHSVVWYSGSSGFNASFLQRSHGMTSGEAGSWLAMLSLIGAIGTFLGGYLGDRLSVRFDDRRWYLWLPAAATLVMVPFQFYSYLANSLPVYMSAFAIMTVLASFFFGPSFAMTQGLATVRMRAVATSLLLFIQTLIGQGLGPLIAGAISDHLKPIYGQDSLRYGLVIVGLVNIWAAAHYYWGARTLREDLAATERLAT
jgi:MFS family permease